MDGNSAEDAMVGALGPDAATALIAQLAGLGLVAVKAEELEQLRREAASYQRMARLVSRSASDSDS